MLTVVPAVPVSNTESEAVDAIVKLFGEYEPFEFSGGGCPCLRNELAAILRRFNPNHNLHIAKEEVNGCDR